VVITATRQRTGPRYGRAWYPCFVSTTIGRVEGGAVRFEVPADWTDGQRVLMIAIPPGELVGTDVPPADLLEEDAREFAPRSEVLASVNKDELA